MEIAHFLATQSLSLSLFRHDVKRSVRSQRRASFICTPGSFLSTVLKRCLNSALTLAAISKPTAGDTNAAGSTDLQSLAAPIGTSPPQARSYSTGVAARASV